MKALPLKGTSDSSASAVLPQMEKALPLCRTSDSRASAVPLSISSISRSCSSVENLAGTSLFCRCSRYRSSSCRQKIRVSGSERVLMRSGVRLSCGGHLAVLQAQVVQVQLRPATSIRRQGHGVLGARLQTSMGLVELNHMFHKTHRHGTGSAAAADKPGGRCRRQRWGSAHHSLVRASLTSSIS